MVTWSTPQHRRAAAAAALAAVGSPRSENQVVSIQCHDGHHVAKVFRTDAGLVFASSTGPHGHGSRDFVDTGHHGDRSGQEFVDLLDVGPTHEDDLPAWCDCGARTLSRADVIDYANSGKRTVHID
ncbi:hypothetical protein [Nocardioides sp.]|uniref:hypothetical protein n=1 Tax=Nocardioides sp. TaxID=35761 RepID=UPI00356471F9